MEVCALVLADRSEAQRFAVCMRLSISPYLLFYHQKRTFRSRPISRSGSRPIAVIISAGWLSRKRTLNRQG